MININRHIDVERGNLIGSHRYIRNNRLLITVEKINLSWNAHCRVVSLETSTLATNSADCMYVYDIYVYMCIHVHTHMDRTIIKEKEAISLRVGDTWGGVKEKFLGREERK